jgi:hypothetical protein
MDLELRPPEPAAVEEVRRLLVEEGVVTRPPTPAAIDWLADLGRALRDALFAWSPRPRLVETGLVAVLVLGAGALVAMLVLALLRRRSAPPPRSREPYLEAGLRHRAVLADAAAWRARLDACLATADRAGALEAMWSWLLAMVAGRDVDVRPLAARRLVRAAGRPDLLPLVRQLEVASYGAEPEPSASDLVDLRDLVDRMEAALAQGASARFAHAR